MVKKIVGLLGLVSVACVLALIFGCEVGSGDTVTRNVNVNITGRYEFTTPVKTSGSPIEWLFIEQTGDDLQGYDQRGIHFGGSLGSVQSTDSGSIVTITMTGDSSIGRNGTLSATITIAGTKATLQGTWIEDNIISYVYGESTVEQPPAKALTVTASPTSAKAGGKVTLTAKGGDGGGSYSWSVSSGGKVDPKEGTLTTCTLDDNVTKGTEVTVTVSSGGSTATSTITVE